MPPKRQRMPISGRFGERDYESFTGFCLPADMTLSGRASRSWASCADHDMGTHNDQLRCR